MELSWWDIPGPRRFVRRVENDLMDRLNVVAALPLGLGRAWFDFFRRRWSAEKERMDVFRVTDATSPPLDLLCDTFTTNPIGTTTIGALANEPGFRGRTVGIILDDQGPVRSWIDFITTYERECRLIDPIDRAVFLLATEGVPLNLLPLSETHLRIHPYEGYAKPHDCYMYAWALMGTEEKQAWRTELKMALCAQLAQWDPRLCEILSDQDIGSILRRSSSTEALTEKQDLDKSVDLDVGWAKGILQRVDGHVIYHSGWVAKDFSSQEFERRVWAAQVQVLFPLIEQIRRQTIERFASRIRLPVIVGYDEKVNDPYELEIAMVRRILYRINGVSRAELRRLDQAWEFRNALAHLRPLSGHQLQTFDPSLNGLGA